MFGVESGVFDCCGGVVGAGFAVFVWLRFETVFVLGVFAGEEGGGGGYGAREGEAGGGADAEVGGGGAWEEGAEGKHCC